MKLRDYQGGIIDKGVRILGKFHLLFLAMEVRTGKTITALSIAKNYGAKNILFVTKKKAIESIKSDCEMIGINATVINYESVLKVVSDYDFVICDESHCISAFPKPSKRAKDIKSIAYKLPIIYLSGTPTPESYSQLFHQFYISMYSPWANYINFYRWAKDYVFLKKKYVFNRELNDYSCANIDKIKHDIQKLFITFTQSEAGFEQKITEKILKCEIHPQAESLARILLRDRIYECKNGDVILADTAVKLQSKLHQIYSGSVKTESGNIIKVDYSKAVFIKEYFKNKKIAIFYKFIGEREILKETFDNYTESPEEFQESESLIYLGQFISSREGIRLDTADAIVFYNIDFAYLSYEQAKNRIVSKERTKEAILYWVFSYGGIEEKIYKAVSNKSDYTNYFFKKDYGIRKQETKKIDN